MNDRGMLLHVSGADAAGIQAGIRAARNARASLPAVQIELVVQGPCVAFLRPVGHLAARQFDGWAYVRV